MNRLNLMLMVAPLICVLVTACSSDIDDGSGPLPGGAYDRLVYQGQTIKVSKRYACWDSYKDDPNNLPHSEIPRIEKLMRAAKPPTTAVDLSTVDTDLQDIQFPGYGMSISPTRQADGSAVELCSVEIPETYLDRYFCYHTIKGTPHLIDDFVLSEDIDEMKGAKITGNRVTYTDMQGKVAMTRRCMEVKH